MRQPIRGRTWGLVRGAVLLLLLLGPVAVGGPLGAVAQEATPAVTTAGATTDLAAMTLVPGDLDDSGFGLDGGQTLGVDDEAEGAADYRGGSADDADSIRDALSKAGFLRRYVSGLVNPPSSERDRTERRISSYAALYDDEDGAADGFALLEDESDVSSAKDLPDTKQFGDESEITRDTGETTDETPRSFTLIDLTFRQGNIVAGVTITDFSGDQPPVKSVEALARIMVERIAATLAATEPGLGSLAARVGGDGLSVPYTYEVYERRDGVTVPLVDESKNLSRARDKGFGHAVDVFSLQQELQVTGVDAEANPFYYVELLRFEDADAAGASFAEPVAPKLIIPAYEEVKKVKDATSFGDDSATYSYAFTLNNDLSTHGYVVLTRVGAVLARVQIDGEPTVPLKAVEAVAKAQVACLEAGSCADAVAVPRSLRTPNTSRTTGTSDETPTARTDATPEADTEETPEAAVDETPAAEEETPDADASGVTGNKYRGPRFGVQLSWNDDWSVEDENSQEGYEGLQLGSTRSTIYVESIDGFDGDPAECLASATADVERRDGVSDVAPTKDFERPVSSRKAGEATLLTYTVTLDDGTEVQGVEYIDCRELIPDQAVVEITAQVGADFYDAQLPLIQDVLATVKLPKVSQAEKTPKAASTPDGDSTPETGATGVKGSTYVGPTYGFRVSWDKDLWSVEEEANEQDYDGLQIGTDRTSVFLEGYTGFRGDADACLADAAQQLKEYDKISDFRRARGTDLPETGGGGDAAAQLYRYTVELDDGSTADVLEYIECRTLVADEAVLEITARVGADYYEDELPAIEDLLTSLGIPSATSSTSDNDATPGAATTPNGAFDPGDGLAGYRSPTFGFELTWNPDDSGWQIEDESSGDGTDVVTLGNGVSTVELDAASDTENGGSAALCLIASAGDDTGRQPVLDASGDAVLGIDGDSRAFAAYRYAKEGVVRYFECRTLASGEAILRITHTAPIADYRDEATIVDDLLSNLKLNDQGRATSHSARI